MNDEPLTPEELRAEAAYRREERIALNGYYEIGRIPAWLNNLAWDEADKAIAILKGEVIDPLKDL